MLIYSPILAQNNKTAVELKKCSKCLESKTVEEFRQRIDKRCDPPLIYTNNTCRGCERVKAFEYYNSKKDDEEFKKLNRDRVKKHQKQNPHVNKERWLQRKNDTEYLKGLKEWRKSNSIKVKELQKHRSYKHHRMLVDSLDNRYLITRIKYSDPSLTDETIEKYPELLDIKRTEILIYRLKQHIHGA